MFSDVETITTIAEFIGIVAFAISGALVAMKRRFDIFGVIVLGVITAVGGGALRDIILGITPPSMFRNSDYVMIAFVTSCLCFAVLRNTTGKRPNKVVSVNARRNCVSANFTSRKNNSDCVSSANKADFDRSSSRPNSEKVRPAGKIYAKKILRAFSPEKLCENKQFFKDAVNFFDAIGLGIFAVTGANTAVTHGFSDNAFLAIFVGVITGIGGGMLRDILAGKVPFVLYKDIYASAAIVGAALYFFMFKIGANPLATVIVPVVTTVAIRIIATCARLELPKSTSVKFKVTSEKFD